MNHVTKFFPLFDDADVGLDIDLVNELTIEAMIDNDVDSDEDIMHNAKVCCQEDIR